VEAGIKAFHVVAGVLDKHLEGRQFIVGKEFTLADIAIASLLAFAGPARFPMEPYKNIQAFNARLDEIPAWRNTAPKMG
jgi:glutathione S-transferase